MTWATTWRDERVTTRRGRCALPLIFSFGAGAEARNAIGWVVFGGLGIAVIFTLYLTPVLYLALARFAKPRADESKRLETELAQAEQLE